MNVLVTGGAGFIGSHLIDALLAHGNKVVCLDNFELGQRNNIVKAMENKCFILQEGDAADIDVLAHLIEHYSIEMVYHLAANSDIQKSAKEPGIDFKNTFKTTYAVLEAMRRCGISRLFFASTSAVYGEKERECVAEDCGNLTPISYYGGAKLASEAFISSYAYMNDINVTIFRFPNVIGPRLTHGVIYDFIRKLEGNPVTLKILGDGTQRKPYIYITDLIEAILFIVHLEEQNVNIYNIGSESSTTVTEIADMVCEKMGLKQVEYEYTSGNRGWKGDVPCFQYNLDKIHKTGWHAKYTSNEAVSLTLDNVLN